MDLRTFLRSLPDDEAREAFAGKCGTTYGHLRNCAYVAGKFPNAPTCVLLEKHSGGALTRRTLRPDWASIWPELAEAKRKTPALVAAR